jgi:hypothetical protein
MIIYCKTNPILPSVSLIDLCIGSTAWRFSPDTIQLSAPFVPFSGICDSESFRFERFKISGFYTQATYCLPPSTILTGTFASDARRAVGRSPNDSDLTMPDKWSDRLDVTYRVSIIVK